MDLFTKFWGRLRPETVYAHCDIPCGIYDPHAAQVAAHTVVRMVDLIHDLPNKKDADETTKAQLLSRYSTTKEQHAEIVKHEIRILWGDYFKPEHAQAYPDLNGTIWSTLKAASKARQTVDKKAAEDLLASVNKIAEIFWKTKGIETGTVKAPYPTEKPLVVPRLK